MAPEVVLNRLEVDDPRWFDFVSGCETATAFHHPAWAGLLADCYGYPSFVLAVADPAGPVVAGLPVVDVSNRLMGPRWVSLPYTDACAPLVSTVCSLENLVARLEAERRAHAIRELEVRADLPGADVSSATAVSHVLELTGGAERVERGFKPSVRRAIAKSHKAGVVVRRADEEADISSIFYGLQLRTRRRKGVPVQPKRYFVRLWQRMLEPGLGFCLLAHHEGAPIAGAVFLAWNTRLLYKYAASDERHLGLHPNHLLLGEAVRWGCENGYSALDLGRTDADNTGLRRFKRSWGAKEEPLVYSILGEDGRTLRSTGRGAAIMEPVIRRAPLAVCRVAGELLYRYAA